MNAVICDIAAEKAVLGGCILNPEHAIPRVMMLRPDDFYNTLHQRIFKTICSTWPEPIDIVTMMGALPELRADYWTSLFEGDFDPLFVENHAAIVRERSVCRQLAGMASRVLSKAGSSISGTDLLSEAYGWIDEVAENASGRGSGSSAQSRLLDIYEKVSCGGIAKGAVIALDGGDFDLAFPVQKGWLVYVTGRPSSGKTTRSIQWAYHVAASGPVAYFSFEVPQLDFDAILGSIASDVPRDHINYGIPEGADSLRKLNEGANAIKNRHEIRTFHVPMTVKQIQLESQRIRDLRAVFIDRIEFIEEPKEKNESENHRLSRVSRQLNKLALQLNVPVICLVQMNRQIERRTDKNPTLADLRDSGALEQDAKMVLAISPPTEEEPGVAVIDVLKAMFGRKGSLRMMWDTTIPMFRPLADQEGHADVYKKPDAGNGKASRSVGLRPVRSLSPRKIEDSGIAERYREAPF